MERGNRQKSKNAHTRDIHKAGLASSFKPDISASTVLPKSRPKLPRRFAKVAQPKSPTVLSEVLPEKKSTRTPTQPTRPALPRTTRSFVLKRQMVLGAQKQKIKAREVKWRHAIAIFLVVTVTGSALILAWSFKDLVLTRIDLFSNKADKPAPQPQLPLTAQDSVTLDETKVTPEQIAQNKMAPTEPNTLRIPKLDISARIKRVGRSLGSEPIAPTNIFDVGWFEASSKPGEPGAVLLNGHAIGPTKSGVFGSLEKLVAGDQLSLQRGDGQVIPYRVVKVQQYSLEELDMVAARQSIDPNLQGLNLMTSRSKYTTANSKKRVIVFAVRAN